MIRRVVAFIWLLLVMTMLPELSTSACSGYFHFPIGRLTEMDILVRATVIDTDEVGLNAIIRVEAYYKGDGPYRLVIMRTSVGWLAGENRWYGPSCGWRPGGKPWVRGDVGYLGLMNNGDGTFDDDGAQFFPVDGNITYYQGMDGEEPNEPQTMPEMDFVRWLLELGRRETPALPSDQFQFPHLMRFLNLTTDSGALYRVNPDRSLSKLPTDSPLATSPDGAHVAFRFDEKMISLQYAFNRHPSFTYTDQYRRFFFPNVEGDPFERFRVEGEAIRFSNDSNLAAIWNRNRLSIVMFSNVDSGIYGLFNIVAEADLMPPVDTSLPTVLWSADSSTVIWKDGSGIWHWNLVEEGEAERVLTVDELTEIDPSNPSLLDVSTHGRYIRVGERAHWTLVDTQTGARYANTLIAPGEQYLIAINDSKQSGVVLAHCRPPLRQNCIVHVVELDFIQWVFPYDRQHIGTVGCTPENYCRISTVQWHPTVSRSLEHFYITAQIRDLRQITYDSAYERPAILVGDYQIYLDWFSTDSIVEYGQGEYAREIDYLDLEGQLDSPIRSIEWGQPIFYDPNLLMAAEWMPQ